MRAYYDRKKIKVMVQQIQNRFATGEKIAISRLITDYFDPKTQNSYFDAEKRTRSWIYGIQNRFLMNGFPFGHFGNGVFGLATTPAEVRAMMTYRYTRVKGQYINAQRFVSAAQKHNLLPANIDTEMMSVPKLLVSENLSETQTKSDQTRSFATS